MRPGYVLPLRWDNDADLAELTEYLTWLAGRADVVVVDGSPPAVFERHARRWCGLVRHVPVAADLRLRNGKVNGVLTGLRHTTADHVVIADDDVRYDERALATVTELLTGADLVLPQNYFHPLPWHARWDTGRILLNRALGHDFPGTLAVRRAALAGGYDGDVLFENLELVRTVQASGGTVHRADHVAVRRRPPTAARFWSQRVRQAYDSLAQPARLAAELAVLPAVAGALLTRRRTALLAGAVTVVIVAEAGRRRAGGTAVFPDGTAWWAPVWLAERGICAWLAVAARLSRGGAYYAGGRIRVAAHSTAWLRAHRVR
ncbi:MAG: glycosyltransferase family 2 protein [Pseudonocardia sp.]|nr:glycosyltransferase family 2 protein [Pseudonocardia sp.]